MKLKTLIGHSLNYGLGSVLPQVIGFLLIPLYTRFLTPRDYGILEMISTLAVFLTPLMKMGIPGAVSRFYFEYHKNKEQLKNFITTIFRILNLGALILSVIALLFLYLFGEDLFGGIKFWPYMFLAVVIAGFGANNHLQKKLIQNRLQSRLNLILQVAFASVNIGLTLLLVVVYKLGAFGSILATAIATFGLYLQSLFYLRKDINGSFEIKMSREARSYGIGILPHHLAVNAGPLITKSFLANLGSLALLGIFSISLRFVSPLILVATSLNTVLVPLYNEARKDGNSEKIYTLIRQILLLSFFAYLTFVLLVPFVMKWSLPQEYHTSIPFIPILSIAFIGRVMYLISVAEIFYQKKTRFISLITISGTIVNVVVCLILVGDYGAKALCWAFSISFIVWALLAYLYKLRISNFRRFNQELILFGIGTSFITLLGFWILNYI